MLSTEYISKVLKWNRKVDFLKVEYKDTLLQLHNEIILVFSVKSVKETGRYSARKCSKNVLLALLLAVTVKTRRWKLQIVVYNRGK